MSAVAVAAKHVKKKKGDDIYPPKEIRENTKARRAWVDAKIAELNGTPNIEARSVGIGTYQHVSVWHLIETDGRIQLRGVCQGCGGSVAMDALWTALHGYTRPGDGYAHGRCPGARQEPANKAIHITERIIRHLRASAEQLDAVALKHEADARDAILPVEVWASENADDKAARLRSYEIRRQCERQAHDARSIAHQNRMFATHLEQTAIPALGTPFTEHVLP